MTDVRLLQGCSAGLVEPTALVAIDYQGDGHLDAEAEARLRSELPDIWTATPLYRIGPAEWPTGLLVDTPGMDGPARRLAEWIVALTVAIQRWTRLPVWRGQVISTENNRLLLAIPWYREPVVRGAVDFAVGIVGRLSQPVPDRAALDDVVAYLRRSIPPAQSSGLSPGTLRYIQAALDRDIPFDVLPGCVQLGWGTRSDRIDGSATSGTGLIATLIAGNEVVARRMLSAAGLPVPHEENPDGQDPLDSRNEGVVHRLLVVRGRLIAAARCRPDGAADEMTAMVHPDNRRLAERAARVVGLDAVGVDLRTTDIGRSWRATGGLIAGLQAQPDLQPHWLADPDRDINGEVLDALYGGRSFRIPTTAIAGAQGSLAAAALHRIWLAAGVKAGLCTQSAVLVGTEVVPTGSAGGHPGCSALLRDPGVEAAVIEISRPGLVDTGHPCDRYDVAAVLGFGDGHQGSGSAVEAEVLHRARLAAVVNADDPLCVAALSAAGTGRRILVGRSPESVAPHRTSGGEAVFMDEQQGDSWIILASGEAAKAFMPLRQVGIQETAALFAIAMAWAHGIDPSSIREGVASFDGRQDQ